MTTALEIVDSAVKIGLGALISGITAYWIGRDRGRQEIRKSALDERRKMLREVALELAKSPDRLDEYMHLTHVANKALIPGKLAENAGLLLDSHKVASQALSLASLLGNSELSKSMQEYADSIEALHRDFAPIEASAPYDYLKALQLVEDIDAKLVATRSNLAIAYAATDA